jgi:hypothetical protein
MSDPTLARPELPELNIADTEYNAAAVEDTARSYALLAADEREAWARADERRKTLELARDIAMEYAPIHVIGANIAHRFQYEIDRKEPT